MIRKLLSVLRCGSISAASAPSRRATRRLATKPASRWSRTRSARRSSRPSSTSCSAPAFRARARSSTWAWWPRWSISPAPGTPTTAKKSVRAATTRANSCVKTQNWRGKSRTRCASRWASPSDRRRRMRTPSRLEPQCAPPFQSRLMPVPQT